MYAPIQWQYMYVSAMRITKYRDFVTDAVLSLLQKTVVPAAVNDDGPLDVIV
jgi:hypothetical protein